MKFLSMNPRLLTLAAVLLLAAPTLYAIPMNGSLQVRLMDGSNTQTLVCCNGGGWPSSRRTNYVRFVDRPSTLGNRFSFCTKLVSSGNAVS